MDLTARAATRVDAPPERVWRALTDPAEVRRYYFGTQLDTDWQPGSPIRWSGEWQGRRYEDHGVVLEADAPRRMRYTHFSPLTGLEDVPENYHDITIDITPEGDGSRVELAQGGNADEAARDHSARNWAMLLDGLKKVVEER